MDYYRSYNYRFTIGFTIDSVSLELYLGYRKLIIFWE